MRLDQSRVENMKLFKTLAIILTVTLFFSGCGDTLSPSPYRPLHESGIQILSTENPYHGPNMLLGRTLEESPSLAGYFHYKGAPKAIEVRDASRRAEELLLYYPEDHRVYVARKRATRAPRDWMVSGPYGIGKHDYRQIRNFMGKPGTSPVFLVNGMMTRYQTHQPKLQRIAFEPEVPLIAKPKPKPKPKPVVKKAPEPKPEEIKVVGGNKVRIRIPDLDDPRFIPRNSDQEALLEARGYAKRAENGDILHPVEGNAQALSNLAHWYMGSVNRVPELQEANQLAETSTEVRKGTTVRIPQRFIKNTKKMPINFRIVKAPVEAPPKPELKKEEKKTEPKTEEPVSTEPVTQS